MAGPLSGIGSQTQSAVAAQAQTQSQQNNQGVRQQDERRETRPDEVQAPNTAVNETQGTNADNLNVAQEENLFAANDLDENGSNPNARRGEILDIAV